MYTISQKNLKNVFDLYNHFQISILKQKHIQKPSLTIANWTLIYKFSCTRFYFKVPQVEATNEKLNTKSK